MQFFRGNKQKCSLFCQQFCVLSYWLTADIRTFTRRLASTLTELPRGFQIAFGHFPTVFYTLLAVPSSCPTAFKIIFQRLSATMWQFLSLFSEGPHFHYHLLRVEGSYENVKNYQQLLF
jgi:hypothetical protein